MYLSAFHKQYCYVLILCQSCLFLFSDFASSHSILQDDRHMLCISYTPPFFLSTFFLSYRHWKFRYFANLAVCFFYPALGPSVGDKWSECICRAAISASFSCLYGDRNTWYASMYFFPNKGPKLLWIMFTVAWVSQTLVNSWLRNLCLMVRQMFIPLWSPLQGLGPICLLKTFYCLCVAGSHWLALESLIPDGISIPAKKATLDD